MDFQYSPPMIPRNPTLRATVFCVLLLAAFCAFAGLKAKEPAPRFTARTTGGEKFTNETIKGKVVLLEFWTTWCPYCFDEAPFVDKINREYGDKGLIILSVNVGESRKTVKNISNNFHAGRVSSSPMTRISRRCTRRRYTRFTSPSTAKETSPEPTTVQAENARFGISWRLPVSGRMTNRT